MGLTVMTRKRCVGKDESVGHLSCNGRGRRGTAIGCLCAAHFCLRERVVELSIDDLILGGFAVERSHPSLAMLC